MGESGGFAGHAAQAKARGHVEVRGLQAAVVEAERLAGAILKIELAVVATRQMALGETAGVVGVEPAVAVEKAARVDGAHL